MPAPVLVTLPLPLMGLAMAHGCVFCSTTVPLLVMLPLPSAPASSPVSCEPLSTVTAPLKPASCAGLASITADWFWIPNRPAPVSVLPSVPCAPCRSSSPASTILPLPRPATWSSVTTAGAAICVVAVSALLAPCTASVPPARLSVPAPLSAPALSPPCATFSTPPFRVSVLPAAPCRLPISCVLPARSSPAPLASATSAVWPMAWSCASCSVPALTVVLPL
ncbi:hypothetical protein WG78_15730 [Amantichitinum ursilacus]|uniref:Uncharacterized protein n=1 Tax=Amantichitinum ursilacus TaxID=857265 RepID=A0A0N1JS82_9NEIS|nr:hypothetical protein WG78_15730 [Amantichitinum ursilacus]